MNAVLADLPAKPSAGPAVVYEKTSETNIYATYTKPDNGGSTILFYEVQVDDGQGGSFHTYVKHLQLYVNVKSAI